MNATVKFFLTEDQIKQIPTNKKSGHLIVGSVTRQPYSPGDPDSNRAGEWIFTGRPLTPDVAEALRKAGKKAANKKAVDKKPKKAGRKKPKTYKRKKKAPLKIASRSEVISAIKDGKLQT